MNSNKIRIGILLGGPSKEREISFAGGRTVYDNLDKTLFEAIPLFVTARRRLVSLDWKYLYKGSIRDFYPPASLALQEEHFQIYEESLDPEEDALHRECETAIGESIEWDDLRQKIDFAFLCLHGEWGEDGLVQAQLESLGIPYSGSGVRASSIGIDKVFQKSLMMAMQLATPRSMIVNRQDMERVDLEEHWSRIREYVGLPLVIRPSRQGSSLGVTILTEDAGYKDFLQALDVGFFRRRIEEVEWNSRSEGQKIRYIQDLIDIRSGIGMPVKVGSIILRSPTEIKKFLDQTRGSVLVENLNQESQLLVEEFVDGTEFSAVVIDDPEEGLICLPPTEIVKEEAVFDYRSKYLPGMSRKRTPIDLPRAVVDRISAECKELYRRFGFQVYARIDGFYRASDDQIFLNDPNTTSGMLPSSFFFHQAAEIGLNPSQFLTFLVESSLYHRAVDNPASGSMQRLRLKLKESLASKLESVRKQKKVAVIFGGFSAERHVSVESGRNIYEKLSSSETYHPEPIFLTGSLENPQLYTLPIRLMLKDNADDIGASLAKEEMHPIVLKAREQGHKILRRIAPEQDMEYFARPISFGEMSERFDFAFIALHGRPGEDGDLQARLQKVNLPYNGSGIKSSRITIDKYRTLSLLRQSGWPTAQQIVVHKGDFDGSQSAPVDSAIQALGLPLIAKPVDEGCSAAVMKIKTREQLKSYFELLFRESDTDTSLRAMSELKIPQTEEVPMVTRVLCEEWLHPESDVEFKEITVGMLIKSEGERRDIHVFQPSETLTSGDILTLEEKFLAGEGQNITPARLGRTEEEFTKISRQIREQIADVAELLEIQGYARIDAFVKIKSPEDVEVIVIEANSLPGMTPATCIYHQAALEGMKPVDFIHEIIKIGFDTPRSEVGQNS